MRQILLERINTSLNQVNLFNMQIKDSEIQEIVTTIHQLKPDVQQINLDNNELSDQGAFILSEGLRKFIKITELSVQFNHIDRKGALDLFSLKNNFPDIDILFHGNKIHDVGEMIEIEHLATTRSGR